MNFRLILGQPDNRGIGSTEYCVHIWLTKNLTYLSDYACHTKFSYICQPKTEIFISQKVFQLDDVTVLEFTSGGCFSAAVKVQSVT